MTPDVAIVGAGPAGAWAAYCLARAGARVTLFDPSHPREKPCGGGLTGRALALVADVLPALGLRAVVVSRARFEAAPDRPDSVPPAVDLALPANGLTPASGLVVVSRADFDRTLLEAAIEAGARLIPERIVALAVTASGVELRTTEGRYAAGWLLGADGANSLARRRLASPFRRSQLSIATGFYAHGVTGTAIGIACVGDPPGYIWSFPRPDHLAIGMGADATAGWTASALRERIRAWLARTGAAAGARLEAYSWPIPSLAPDDLDGERPAGPRWMLLGDAAGLADPLTREGLYYALLSGEWAAEALTEDATHAPRRYEHRLREEVYPELRRAAQTKAGFFRPAFTELLVEALDRSEEIRDVMVNLIVGRQPYRGLRRRLLQTLELGFAWRLLRLTLATRGARWSSLVSDNS